MSAQCIGIGGMSQAGKSALAGRLATAWSDRTVAVLAMDDFCFSENTLPFWTDSSGVQHRDWEHPDSVDDSSLTKAIKKAISTHDVVLVEGILIFHHQSINELFDVRIMLEVDELTFFQRRASDLRWGKPNQAYLQHVWEAYWENKKGLDLEDINVFRSSNPSDDAFEFLVR